MGKIYKIVCGDLTYYGRTTQSLSQRFQDHKRSYKKWARNEGYEYCASFPLFELGEPQMLLVEDAPNLTKNELHNLEYQYIANNDNINIHGKMKSDIHQCHVDFKKKYPDKRTGIRVIYEDLEDYKVVVE